MVSNQLYWFSQVIKEIKKTIYVKSDFNLLWSRVRPCPLTNASIRVCGNVDKVYVSSDVGQLVVHVAAWALCSLQSLTLNYPPRAATNSKCHLFSTFLPFSRIYLQIVEANHSCSLPSICIISLLDMGGLTSGTIIYLVLTVEITLIYFKGHFCTMWWRACQSHWDELLQHFLGLGMWKITL